MSDAIFTALYQKESEPYFACESNLLFIFPLNL
jgi:hypothetical protein